MPVAQDRLEILQICKLLQVVREGNKEQIDKLTLNGIPHLINYNDPNEGETALAIAAVSNNEEMIDFLLDRGAHPDVQDFKGRTAVMRAAEYGHIQCMEALCRRKADMKLRDMEGKGILFYLISPTERHAKCTEIALEHGAEVNNKTLDGKPVFLLACETASENEEMCLKLMEKNADPNSMNENKGRTALMAAAGSGSEKVVRAILEKGGDVNAVDKKRQTATHEASKYGHLDVLRVLSAYGADFDLIDDKGNSPVHYAANGHGLCCRFLIQRGCNPKPKNMEGNQAKVIAKEGSHKEAMKELRKGEKSFGKTGKNNDPWIIELYDWCLERQQKISNMFQQFDADGVGTVPKDDFIDSLVGLGAPIPDEHQKTIVLAHDKNKDGMVDYGDFLGGKKYVNKQFLMSAYEGKKKKKKGGKGKKKKVPTATLR